MEELIVGAIEGDSPEGTPSKGKLYFRVLGHKSNFKKSVFSNPFLSETPFLFNKGTLRSITQNKSILDNKMFSVFRSSPRGGRRLCGEFWGPELPGSSSCGSPEQSRLPQESQAGGMAVTGDGPTVP